VATPASPAWIGGDGLPRVTEILGPAIIPAPAGSPAHSISAVYLARRARRGGARPVVPLYLRLPDAEVNRLKRVREGAAA
jgi:hypothetical protein